MIDAQMARRRPQDPSVYSHSRTRTTSSNTFPSIQSPTPMHLVQPSTNHSRRSPSVNTFNSFNSNSAMAPPAAYRTSPTAEIRRSTSSRSGGGVSPQPGSYVALLRRQKATVWCDRAQYEDPRLLEKQKAAKIRATIEVSGSPANANVAGGNARTATGLSTGKIATKIRHHGKPGVVGYSPEQNYVGVGGVPLRLSATEVEGGDSDEEDPAVMQRLHHRRTGSSGRSSTASRRRDVSYRSATGLSGQAGQGRRWSPGDTPERSGSLSEDKTADDGASTRASTRARSTGSGSSAERADNVPDLSSNAARLAANSLMHSTITREKSVKNPDELRRRGSVDERTTTLTGGRLYIANPD